MDNLLWIFISALLVNNFVLVRFLGLCPFMGVSKNLEAAANWLACRAALIEAGYTQTTLTNFEREPRFRYERSSFQPDVFDALGFGPGGIDAPGAGTLEECCAACVAVCRSSKRLQIFKSGGSDESPYSYTETREDVGGTVDYPEPGPSQYSRGLPGGPDPEGGGHFFSKEGRSPESEAR